MKTIILLALFSFHYINSKAQCWSAASGGGYNSFAIKSDSTFWAWGDNVQGQLGIIGGYGPSPLKLPFKALSVSSGDYHTIAIKDDSTLWSWGLNNYGQLGDGTAIWGNFRGYPAQIGTYKWKSIEASNDYNLAIKSDGTLWSWGWSGGLIQDTTGWYKYSPYLINADTDWKCVSAGGGNNLAIKNNGTLWSWGGTFGSTGDGTTIPKQYPVKIGNDSWQSISASNGFNIAVKTDGTLWSWGYNFLYAGIPTGNLGNDIDSNRTVPGQIGTENNWKYVATGLSHVLAVKADGSLWAWGWNVFGQLGDGTMINRHIPTKIGNDTRWQSVAAGYGHSIAIKSDGSLWLWGSNYGGESGASNDFLTPFQQICPTLAPVPIKIISVNLLKRANDILITWRTATESNSKEYQIEHSTDGVTFKMIAISISENDPTGFKYSYIDINPSIGLNYYRIKCLDEDGTFSYSPIVKSNFFSTENFVNIYPNPVNDFLFIESNFKKERIKINITDQVERSILQSVKPSNELIKIATNNLAPGIYFVTISDDKNRITKKIVKE